jgi:hypothetical protein
MIRVFLGTEIYNDGKGKGILSPGRPRTDRKESPWELGNKKTFPLSGSIRYKKKLRF